MPRSVVILQARMGSSRLPGKVLARLDDDVLLGHCLRRLRALGADEVVVATSALHRDDPVADHAAALGAPVFRGSEEDVLDRYRAAAAVFEADLIVRATGDNPFVDPVCGRMLLEHMRLGGCDYASTHGESGGLRLPLGTGLECFTRAALEQSWAEGLAPHHREHVNEFILENPTRFRVAGLPPPPGLSAPGLRLTVDTPEDLAFVRAMAGEIGQPCSALTLPRIIAWWKGARRAGR